MPILDVDGDGVILPHHVAWVSALSTDPPGPKTRTMIGVTSRAAQARDSPSTCLLPPRRHEKKGRG